VAVPPESSAPYRQRAPPIFVFVFSITASCRCLPDGWGPQSTIGVNLATCAGRARGSEQVICVGYRLDLPWYAWLAMKRTVLLHEDLAKGDRFRRIKKTGWARRNCRHMQFISIMRLSVWRSL